MKNLKEVIQEMKKLTNDKKQIPFTLVVRSFNRQNKLGGKLIRFDNATLLQQPKEKTIFEKNPNHWENRTLNIKLKNGEIKKINKLFIISFNGEDVIY